MGSKYVRILLLTSVCIILACANLFGQAVVIETPKERIAAYNRAKPSDVLYLVTDKQVYLPTETIWFAAYIVEPVGKGDSTLRPEILSVALLRADTGGVSLRKKYLIKNYTSEGSLTLPSSIAPGNYLLLACTNIADAKGKPIHVFRMSITIKSETLPSIVVDFEVKDKAGTDSVFVFAKAPFSTGIAMADWENAQLSYRLGDGKQKKVKYDFTGLAVLAFRRSELKNTSNLIQTVTKIGKSTRSFNVRLPILEPDKLEIGFYPEGGDLVIGLMSKVAWQAVLKDGTGRKVKAMLLENGKVIDTIVTDERGTGVFNLRPKAQTAYGVQLLGGADSAKAQLYPLPLALPSGTVLKIAHALASDTLTVGISTTEAGKLSLAISSAYTRETIITPLFAIERQGKKMKIPLAEVKKGLNTLTLLDSLGRPVAERLFFAHFNKRARASVTTDTNIYRTGQRIALNVSLATANGEPMDGLFTISCVQQSRLDSTARQDLAAYYYMKPIVGGQEHSPLNSTLGLTNNGTYLERMLLISGRRYLWQDMLRSSIDTARLGFRALALRAQFRYADGGRIKEVMPVSIRRDSIVSTVILTDRNGYISPKPAEFSIAENNSLDIKLINKKGKAIGSTLVVEDPMVELMEQVLAIPRRALIRDVPLQRSGDLVLITHFDRTNQLQEVSITGRIPMEKADGYGPNKCGDYVCGSGYLNCPGHSPFSFDNQPPPVKGKTYRLLTKGPIKEIIYQGCQWENDGLALYTARQFYSVDPIKRKTTDEKEYLSTLFWKAFTTSSATVPSYFEFHTGDLTGSFKVRVEGISADGDLFYEEKNIMIRK